MSIKYYDPKLAHGFVSTHCLVNKDCPNLMLTAKTWQAFHIMQEAALKDGIKLEIASAFRSFERQKLIFSEKFKGNRPVLTPEEDVIENFNSLSDLEKVKAITFFSAIPGLSRHHYGTDIDVYASNLLSENEKLDLTNKVYSTGSQAKLSEWLTDNMQKFYFFRPYQTKNSLYANELWHISYYPEADKFTEHLDKVECLDFLSKNIDFGREAILNIVENEFDDRFKLFFKKF